MVGIVSRVFACKNVGFDYRNVLPAVYGIKSEKKLRIVLGLFCPRDQSGIRLPSIDDASDSNLDNKLVFPLWAGRGLQSPCHSQNKLPYALFEDCRNYDSYRPSTPPISVSILDVAWAF
jgi:hypothetical protein